MTKKQIERERKIKILMDIRSGKLSISDLREGDIFEVTLDLSGKSRTPEQEAEDEATDRANRAKGHKVYRVTLNLN